VEEVEEGKEIEEKKNRPRTNTQARFFLRLLHFLGFLNFLYSPLLPLVYFGAVEIPPAGFLIVSL
jgi:hypothetical protein